MIDILEGTTFNWQPFLLKNKPRFIILGFKITKIDQQENNSKFVSDKIKSLRVKLNNSNYPMNKMEMSESYYHCIQMCKTFNINSNLGILDFINLYSIFRFDVRAQNKN